MKTFFYIFGPIVFAAFILINQKTPEETTKEFQLKEREMHIEELTLNQKINQVESEFNETTILIQEEKK
jgi:hypothetical protein